jgi:3-oxoacyl-[acyl-carrier protein] reductase
MPQTFIPRDRLDGEIAVITGGTGAIGSATAHRLASLGARVALLHRGSNIDGTRVLANLPGKGHVAVTASITNSDSLAHAASTVEASVGSATILVNCAGSTKPVPPSDLEGLTDALIDDMFAINWRGTFATIRAFSPQMQRSTEAVIVNVSSIAAFTGIGSNLAYAAAKAGTDALTKALAKSLAPRVRVLAVSPGVVATDFVAGRDEAFNTRVAMSTPLGRVGGVDDVASAIAACCTSLRFATGSIVVVDGGRHLG